MKKIFLLLVAMSLLQATSICAVSTLNLQCTPVTGCSGAENGSLTISISNGTAPYDYYWSSGTSTMFIDNANSPFAILNNMMPAGTYNVTVIDQGGAGQSLTGSCTITQPDPVQININPANASCVTACDGIADATVIGGSGNYQLNWSTGETGTTAHDLCPNVSYTISAFDNNNCSASVTFLIGIDSNGQTDFDNDGTPDCADSCSLDPDKIVPGDCGCGIADVDANFNGISDCNDTDSCLNFSVIVGYGGDNTNCQLPCNGQVYGNNVSGGTAPYTYLWNNGATTQNQIGVCPGMYILTVTDDDGCTASSQHEVSGKIPGLSATAQGFDNQNCNAPCNGSATVNVTGGNEPIQSYEWNNGHNSMNPFELCPGSYTVTVTDDKGCTATSTATVAGPPGNLAVVIGYGGDNTNCQLPCNGQVYGNNVSGGTAPYTYLWNNGATTQNQIGVCPGMYILTVTDANGCTASSQHEVFGKIPGLSATAQGFDNQNCNAPCNGSATVNVTGGNEPIQSYEWNNGHNSMNPFELCPGSYTVTVTDDKGCTATSTATVAGPPGNLAVVVGYGGDNTNCQLPCNGQVYGNNVTGGTAPYNHLWNNGATTQNQIGVCPGMYILTVTDANGCTASSQHEVSGKIPGLSATAQGFNHSGCAPCNGSATVNVTGGNEPLQSYNWNSGSVSMNPFELCPGTYIVTVTDNQGCTASSSTNVGGTVLTAITINGTITSPLCAGNKGSIAVTITGGSGIGLSYNWSNGNTTASIANLDPGNYTVTVTDDGNCSADRTFTINQPTISMNVFNNVNYSWCTNPPTGSASIIVNSGTQPYTYLWNTGATTASIINLAVGTYICTVTDANGCSKASPSGYVSSGHWISAVNVTGSASNCNNGRIDARVFDNVGQSPGTYTYTWSGPGGYTGTGSLITGLAPGNYSVTATAFQCTLTSSMNVPDLGNIAPTVSSAIAPVSCNGGNNGWINLSISGCAPFVINATGPNGYTGNAQVLENLRAGNYRIIVTGAGGFADTANYTVTEPALVVDTATNIVCQGNSIKIGVSGGSSYSWNTGATTDSITVTPAATNTYSVTITNSGNCSITATRTVSVNSISISGTTVSATCSASSNGSVKIIVSGGSPAYSYLWNNGATADSISGLAPGNFTITATDAIGCSAVQTFTVSNQTPILAYLGTFGEDTCTRGTGFINLDIQGLGTGPYTYNWAGPNGFSSTVAGISGLHEGDYFVTVTDINGCTGTNGIHVHNKTEPLNITGTIVAESCSSRCDGSILNVVATNAPGPYYRTWAHTTLNYSTMYQLCAGTYSVTMDANGCTGTKSFTVGQGKTIWAYGGVMKDDTCGRGSGSINLNIQGDGTPPYTYSWNGPNGISTTSALSGLHEGDYYVTVTDANGCTGNNGIHLSNRTELLNITGTIVAESCTTKCDGSILNVVATNAPGPYYRTWAHTTLNYSTMYQLCGGTYSVTMDANGCTGTKSFVVNPGKTIWAYGGVMKDDTCGRGTGSISLNVQGDGTPPYTYSWNGPNGIFTASALSGLHVGDYFVTVTDANGCTGNNGIHLSNRTEQLNIVGTIVNESCSPKCDGSVLNVIAANAPGPYYRTWAHTTLNYSTMYQLCGGTYSVTMDANGCTGTKSFVVNPGKTIWAYGGVMKDDTCGRGTGSISLNVQGDGTPPYTYSWNGPNGIFTASALSGLHVGDYFVTVTDANGCTGNNGIHLSNRTEQLNIVGTIVNESCSPKFDGSVLNVIAANAPGPYYRTWAHTTLNYSTMHQLCAGTYSVTMDANGCSGTKSFTVDQDKTIWAYGGVMNDDTSGRGTGYISLNIQGNGTLPYTYNWSGPEGFSSNNTFISGLHEGDYFVTVTDADGCTGTNGIHLNNISDPNLPTGVQEISAAASGLKVYPNPFSDALNFNFTLLQDAHVQISLFDLAGREIELLERTAMQKGEQQLVWNKGLHGLVPGIYFARIKINDIIQTTKIVYQP